MSLLIFDLDGTLIDSRVDLANAVNATREHMGLTPLDGETVSSYVGNGASVLIRRAIGPDAPEEDLEQALTFFLASYREHALDYTTLYPGVKDGLELLRKNGSQMAVLTNKPVDISESILSGLGIQAWFSRVYGGNSFQFKKPHPIGIQMLMTETAVKPEETVMVGDSDVDVQTGRAAGVKVCGVSYGFKPESFAEFPPDFIVDSLVELAAPRDEWR